MNGFIPWHPVLVMLALLVGTFALAAQPTPEKRPRTEARETTQRRPMLDRAGLRPGGMGSAYLPQLERVLTDEQLLSLRQAVEGQREQRRDLEQKLGEARSALWKASVIETFDETTVRAKALEVGKLEAELIVLRAKAFAEVLPALSAEQLEKLRNAGPAAAPGGARPPWRERSDLPPREQKELPAK
jgi:Spy/CpxP family protein refolding chaperone